MKRLRVDESAKESSGPPLNSALYRPALTNATPTIAYTTGTSAVKVVSEGMQSGLYQSTTPVSFGVMPAAAAPHPVKPQAMQPLSVGGGGHPQMRAQGASPPAAPTQEPQPQQQQQPQPQQPQPPQGNSFQRLKVEDALSYLDLVKYKFGSKPQVYNDFLDIMKEFKSQSIDTPGVIQRVSSLFKGFPDLIVGFNTFLPPGYKIEVQRNDQGYAFQVSVSMPSPTGTMPTDSQTQKSAMIFRGSGPINMMSAAQPAPVQQPPQTVSIASQQVAPVAPHAPPAPTTLHHPTNYGSSAPVHNNSSHAALTVAAVSQVLQAHVDAPQNQPVEFNHAINYVNKIKNRFQGQPEKYKRFLEILHTYQKEQRTLKETSQGQAGNIKHLTEQEVYSQVAKLFEHQSDLLAEFGQFLPDATSHISQPPLSEHVPPMAKKQPSKQPYMLDKHISHKSSHMSGQLKRSPPYPNLMHRDAPPPKKHKVASCRDVTLAEAGKCSSLNDFAFFDKVRKALRSPDVYNNFLRCLTLFNQEIVSKSELLQLVTPFLGKFPELMRWFRDFLGQGETEPIAFNVVNRAERPQGDHALELDLSTAKRLGASYCVIPPSQEGQRCSGRTQLCREVLNDQWVSFPTWSEDSTFVSSRKTQYEEYMYRCEDERFELDVVIETNASTIRVLEGVNKKISRMSSEELAKFRLDDCLGGSSLVLHQRALKRIYGEKAPDIIDGLKRNPVVAVPVVLRRLKTKEEEWREAQKGFNKIWREQNEKYYLKSLDHQGINFKQNDVKALRSKNLFNEIETLFDERHEQNEDGGNSEPIVGPHLVFPYRDRTILDDATNLLMHHVKRQTGVQKGEKRRIKQILCHFVPDLFFHPRQQLSDDEREDDDEKEDGDESPKSNSSGTDSTKGKQGKSPRRASDSEGADEKLDMKDIKEEEIPLHAQCSDPDEAYTLFMANNNWYIFLRLHAILCERLAKIYERTISLANEEAKLRTNRKESTAMALRLKPKPQIEVENYYTAFLEMVKNLLDGNMESNAYEDTLREMFGIHAYIAFTLDKVVQYAVRQLQHCVTERTAIACAKLFQREQKRGGAGGPCATVHRRVRTEMMYQKAAEKAVQDENCFKIVIYKNDCKMTIELLDTESEDSKKVEDSKKWSEYKDDFVNVSSSSSKPRSPVYLNRNLRNNKRRKQQLKESGEGKSSGEAKANNSVVDGEKLTPLEELERKLNERPPLERNQTEHPGYDVSDETQCKFNSVDKKIMFTVNKDSYLYKHCAFSRAKQTHPKVTKRLSARFRAWLKRWSSTNVTDAQHKQCTDWLMGRGDGVVPNRTRVLTDNDLSRTPYVPYNRYRVERLTSDQQQQQQPSA